MMTQLTCENIILDEVRKVDDLLSLWQRALHLSRLLLHLLFCDGIGRIFTGGSPQCAISSSITIHRRTDAIIDSQRLGHIVEHSFLHLEKRRGEDGTGNSRLDGEFIGEVQRGVEALVVIPGGITGVKALESLAGGEVTLVVPSVVGSAVGADGPVRIVGRLFVDFPLGGCDSGG